jgi:hypothetical protein
MGGIIDTLTVKLCLDTSEFDAAIVRVRATLRQLDEDLKAASRILQPSEKTVGIDGSVMENAYG